MAYAYHYEEEVATLLHHLFPPSNKSKQDSVSQSLWDAGTSTETEEAHVWKKLRIEALANQNFRQKVEALQF